MSLSKQISPNRFKSFIYELIPENPRTDLAKGGLSPIDASPLPVGRRYKFYLIKISSSSNFNNRFNLTS
ncbi:hypothetical protein PGT21_001670 [Puccinia graminis f. sp. tritici]|uniref:Uncharacterized protein n=1 Tax=Puccinia graminis f. sp. tritici TaxID=56615 RepID=A0A5B0NL65_PUCGR|nr:hypothetical protein PGT21_001670 [Puccinia graminis f. sp. tritici]